MKNALLVALLFVSITAYTQASITVENPSFEDLPRHSHTPRYWENCGFEGETPPDISPNLTFMNATPAIDGSTYLSMVTRDNDTYECVSTILSAPLQKNKTYTLRVALMRSLKYVSTSRLTKQAANYVTPVCLRIWGAAKENGDQELLGVSPLIQHAEWEYYEFILAPEIDDVNFIYLEAFYKEPTLFSYNGNIGVDDLSSITEVNIENLPELNARVQRVEKKVEIHVSNVDEELITDVLNPDKLSAYFTSDLLPTIFFDGDHSFANQQYQLNNEETYYDGNASLFTLAQAITYHTFTDWELVVFHEDHDITMQRVDAINAQLEDMQNTQLTAVPYNEKEHADAKWFATSAHQGLYLLGRTI